MTASATTHAQSSRPSDSGKSSQGTGNERFSSHLKDETSRKDSASKSNQEACDRHSCQDTSVNNEPESNPTIANDTGNRVPEGGSNAPKEVSEKDAIEQELSALEAELSVELAEIDATTTATPADASIATATPVQTSIAAATSSTLESLQKLYPGATNNLNSNIQATGTLGESKNGAPSAITNGSSAAIELQNAALNTNKPPPETPIKPATAVETDIDKVLAKMVEAKEAQAKPIPSGGPAVNILTAMSDLGRPAFVATPLAQAPVVPQAPLSMQQPGMHQAMGNSVQWMLKEGLQEANIRVKPSELGPITIKLSMNNEQLTMSLSATHAATREALEAHIPRIREALAASHVNLGSVEVSDQNLPQQRSETEFAEFSGEREQRFEEQASELAANDVNLSNEEDAEEVHLTSLLPVRETAGVLDLFA